MLTQNLLLKYARQADKAAFFNYASMAHNNHFFFKYISPSPTIIPPSLEQDIIEDFSSVDSLRAEFINTANAMFGPGFVWLIRTGSGNLRILATYIAGSPYAGAHFRMQPVDMATQNASAVGALRGMEWARQQEVSNTVGSMGRHSGKEKVVAPGGLEVIPVLCVNTWEHVWLRDFGIKGKSDFLEAWWEKIDWNLLDDASRRKRADWPANNHG
ncbi:MAG: hypothetical protein M1830_007000 [Pleopsidium flavum]|nr:MAG: hypothetical protein M1830_007000 [Pleopsidium flavum]